MNSLHNMVPEISMTPKINFKRVNKSPFRTKGIKIESDDIQSGQSLICLRKNNYSFSLISGLSPNNHPFGEQKRAIFTKIQQKTPKKSLEQLWNARQKEASKLQTVHVKIRKNSQNNNLRSQEFQFSPIKTKFNNQNKQTQNLSRQKYRKGSFEINQSIFLKSPQKQKSSNNLMKIKLENKHKADSQLVKIKPNQWIQTTNFNLSPNCEEINYHVTPQSKALKPKKSNGLQFSKNIVRKNSANFNIKFPSFLSTPKRHKMSFNLNQSIKIPVRIQDFSIIRQLGNGAFGKVVLAVEKASQFVCAIKIMSKKDIIQDNMLQQVVRQLKIQLYLNHPNIVKVYGYFEDLLNFYIIMECALDGNLSSRLNNISSDQESVSIVFYQICSAIRAIHSSQIIHRDLKPQNIMFQEGVVKICDFGWSIYRQSSLRSTFCGTPLYLCPEILLGDAYDESIDIWALGVILYQMLFKANPFNITTRSQLVNILDSQINFEQRLKISQEVRDLIQKCLSKRAVDRLNIRQILLHQFVLKGQAAEELRK